MIPPLAKGFILAEYKCPAGRRRGDITAKSGLTPVKHKGNGFIYAGGLPYKR